MSGRASRLENREKIETKRLSGSALENYTALKGIAYILSVLQTVTNRKVSISKSRRNIEWRVEKTHSSSGGVLAFDRASLANKMYFWVFVVENWCLFSEHVCSKNWGFVILGWSFIQSLQKWCQFCAHVFFHLLKIVNNREVSFQNMFYEFLTIKYRLCNGTFLLCFVCKLCQYCMERSDLSHTLKKEQWDWNFIMFSHNLIKAVNYKWKEKFTIFFC